MNAKSNTKKHPTPIQHEINTSWHYLASSLSKNFPGIIETGYVQKKLPGAIAYRFERFIWLLLNKFKPRPNQPPKRRIESEAVYGLVRAIMEEINSTSVTDAYIQKQFQKFESLRMALTIPHTLNRTHRKNIIDANRFFEALYSYRAP